MARVARQTSAEIDAALLAARGARTLAELRQAQAILVPALTGAGLEIAAQILGLGRDRVSTLRRQFRQGDAPTDDAQSGRGGRRNQLLSSERERQLILRAAAAAQQQHGGVVTILRTELERALHRGVPLSTVYRMLHRHGWRKHQAGAWMPDERGPESRPVERAAVRGRTPGTHDNNLMNANSDTWIRGI